MADYARRQELIARLYKRGLNGRSAVWAVRLEQGECPICGLFPRLSACETEIERKELELSHVCASCQQDIYCLRVDSDPAEESKRNYNERANTERTHENRTLHAATGSLQGCEGADLLAGNSPNGRPLPGGDLGR